MIRTKVPVPPCPFKAPTRRHVEDNSKRALWGVPAAGPKATTPKDTPIALAHLPPDRPVVLVRQSLP